MKRHYSIEENECSCLSSLLDFDSCTLVICPLYCSEQQKKKIYEFMHIYHSVDSAVFADEVQFGSVRSSEKWQPYLSELNKSCNNKKHHQLQNLTFFTTTTKTITLIHPSLAIESLQFFLFSSVGKRIDEQLLPNVFVGSLYEVNWKWQLLVVSKVKFVSNFNNKKLLGAILCFSVG